MGRFAFGARMYCESRGCESRLSDRSDLLNETPDLAPDEKYIRAPSPPANRGGTNGGRESPRNYMLAVHERPEWKWKKMREDVRIQVSPCSFGSVALVGGTSRPSLPTRCHSALRDPLWRVKLVTVNDP